MGATPVTPPHVGDASTLVVSPDADVCVEIAKTSGRPNSGHHNVNHFVRLSEGLARHVDHQPGTAVTVRVPRHDALVVVVRTWEDEGEILRAAGRALPHVPEFLHAGSGFAVLGYVAGIPLSRYCGNGKPVPPDLIDALARLLAQMAVVRETGQLPSLPTDWPADGDTRGFLRRLASTTNDLVVEGNWQAFGALFRELRVPRNALARFAESLPPMTARPFSMLHCDLHCGNVIVSHGQRPPLFVVDWELASYGDPLHDLAIHMVRTRYPRDQWDAVVHAWKQAMAFVRPEAMAGTDEDLGLYLAFERLQSVFSDVMRAARSLEGTFDQKRLDEATDVVSGALKAARRTLGFRRVRSRAKIAKILRRWRAARRAAVCPTPAWHADRRVPEHPHFPRSAVDEVLRLETEAPARRVFAGSTHQNTLIDVPGIGFPVMLRRKLRDASRLERGLLSEHAVLRIIKESPDVAAPEVLALGMTAERELFVVHTYEGPRDGTPVHPVHGLRPHEADALVDQLVALSRVDGAHVDPTACGINFYDGLRDQLVNLVRNLPEETQDMVRILGLPEADRLHDILSLQHVEPQPSSLLHGDLNPWNLVRRNDRLALTLIDWERALVGDPLYDLVRHLQLTPNSREIRGRMLRRWAKAMGRGSGSDLYADFNAYRQMEIARAAYVDLHRLVSGEGLHTPGGRSAVDSYMTTHVKAIGALGLLRYLPENPYLTLPLH